MSSRGRFPLFVAGSAAETAISAGGPAEDLTLASDMPTESFLLGGAWCAIAFFSSSVYVVVASGLSPLTLRFWIVFKNEKREDKQKTRKSRKKRSLP